MSLQQLRVEESRTLVRPIGHTVVCSRAACKVSLGYITDGVFVRAGTADIIMPPATMSLVCRCGYRSSLELTREGSGA